MEYYAKLDNTNHIVNIYLTTQLTRTDGYELVSVPDSLQELFMKDWTNFYVKSDGSLDFDGNKATQTQQLIDSLEATNDQQAALNRQVLSALAKVNAQLAAK